MQYNEEHYSRIIRRNTCSDITIVVRGDLLKEPIKYGWL